MNNSKVILAILDGWGLGTDPQVDALAKADTPVMDKLMQSSPNATLITFGEEVGLPEGQMGNSEVGHLNIGAGRVVYQDLAKINKAIRDGNFAEEQVLQNAFAKAKSNNSTLHFIGLLSDGGVHSHINHLEALCDAATAAKLSDIKIHAFLDGRDTDPHGGKTYVKQLQKHIENQPVELASLTGRYYAMDRDNRWERIQMAYDALVAGKGELSDSLLSTLEKRYEDGQTDEFITPILKANEKGEAISTIQDGDVVVFFNFRTDRPRQLTIALTQRNLQGVSDGSPYNMKKLDLHFVTMTRYDDTFKNLHVVYLKEDLKATLGEVLANAGKSQLRIAETEKFPHVTFFFNGGREEAFENEARAILPSPKVATYDLKPEMSAFDIRDTLLEHMNENKPDFVCVNFANTDMVGHTGVMEAAIVAAQTVDDCLGDILKEAEKLDYDVIVIADHGNSDKMVNEDGSPNTAHTTNLVPIIYSAKSDKYTRVLDGKLGDIAPTVLALLGIEQPTEMTGKSLLK